MNNRDVIGLAICISSLTLFLLVYFHFDPNKNIENNHYDTASYEKKVITLNIAGRNIDKEIEHLNNLLRKKAIEFKIVTTKADINVTFKDNIGTPEAIGIAYPVFGQVYIQNDIPARQLLVVLIHEILHCAGVGHNPHDPSSVMYPNSQVRGDVSQLHVDLLKRLSGAGLDDRVRAQLNLIAGIYACKYSDKWECIAD